VNTTRKLLAGGIALAAMMGTIAVASNANSATSYLGVSLDALGTGSSAVWDSAGNPDLTVGSSTGSEAEVVINGDDTTAHADAPTFTTDNYADGSPYWYLQFVRGDELVGYPSQAGLGTSNWTVIIAPPADCTVANPPVDVTYAAALTFLQNSVCGGTVVSHAEIIAEGQSPGTSDDLSGISYDVLFVGILWGTALQSRTCGESVGTRTCRSRRPCGSRAPGNRKYSKNRMSRSGSRRRRGALIAADQDAVTRACRTVDYPSYVGSVTLTLPSR
jgi:hypothetical protein